MAKKETAMTPYADALPEFLRDEDGNLGNEDVRPEDLTIPRLAQCQAMSECRKSNSPEFIDGIQEGDLYNTVTRENYGQDVLFVPVLQRTEFIVWRDQDKGGGFYGAFSSMDEAEAARRDLDNVNPDDCESIETKQQFGLLISGDPDSPRIEEIVCPMSSSKMRANRRLNTLIRMAGGNRFTRVYRFKSVAERSKVNNKEYANIEVSPVGYVTPEIYARAKQLYQAVSSGNKDVERGPAPRGTSYADGDDLVDPLEMDV